MDLFDQVVEYPGDIAANPFPLGVLYSYVSSTLLNGMINYVDIQAAYLITRYRAHSKNVATAAKFNAGRDFHAQLSSMHDDLLILAQASAQDDPAYWWFFWFDCDVSDCQIGRFRCQVDDEQKAELLACFAEWAETKSQVLSDSYASEMDDPEEDEDTSENKGGKPAIRLEPTAFRGWISW